MKICIIGKGSIGTRHKKIFEKLGCNVYFFRSSGKKNIKENFFKDIYNYRDLKKIKFDLYCICNPTSLHFKTFKKISTYAKNVFVEKPLVSNKNQFLNFKKIQKKYKINLFTGFMLRHDPRIIDIKKKILKFTYKKVRYANFIWHTYLPNWHPKENYRKSYASQKKLGGGVILTCSHEIDMAINLFGEVRNVFCVETNSTINTNVENSIFLILKHRNNIVSNLNIDFSSKVHNKRKFEIILNDNIIKWNFNYHNYILKNKKISVRRNSKINQIYFYQNRSILDNLNIKSKLKFDKIFHTEKVLFAAKESLKNKKIIKIR